MNFICIIDTYENGFYFQKENLLSSVEYKFPPHELYNYLLQI